MLEVDFILQHKDRGGIIYDELDDEELLQLTFEDLPIYQDPRQRRLFPKKKLRLFWSKITPKLAHSI